MLFTALTKSCQKLLRHSSKLHLLRLSQSSYHMASQNELQNGQGHWIVDMRSDTLTKPTPSMRQAMANAEVGDDVFGEDPTVNELQKRCADLFGKEAALFVPTGTMGNLISIMTHCQGRGIEAIIGDNSHIMRYEQGGIAQFAGVMSAIIHNKPDGTVDLEELKSKIRPLDDPHQPHTKLICLENTHNCCGGKILPISFLKEVYNIAQENNLIVHLDGARVLNAAIALNIPVSDILQYADSVNMCFSKGLAAPVGSIIAGTRPFIDTAVRVRKALGGGLRQSGILAAAALYSLDNIVPHLGNDHVHAKKLAKGIMSVDQNVAFINIEDVHTNILMITIVSETVSAEMVIKRLAQVTAAEENELGCGIVVKGMAWGLKLVRFVTHNDVSTADIEKGVLKVQFVLKELSFL
ncbi:probable low-specificity L-threonine aldolase 2 [Pecten maximus]|uniref:probable low-specificity L-threonine aldolase 2 n=1 Tax=Pecten maximus TaxID=6579 RepID=UPI001458A82A|nr:probable low-specificity L-threonine aldolase 2 [Pecten maximus]